MRNLTILTLLLLLNACISHPADCSRFRNGKYKSILHGHPYIIERNGSLQKEYILGTKDSTIAYFDVKWLNDYTYILQPSAATLKKMPKYPKNSIMTVEIIRTTPRSYTERATTNFSDKEVEEDFTETN